MTKDLKFELIKWDDARSFNGWHDINDDFQPAKCVSVGWVVFEDDNKLVLVGTINHTDDNLGDPWVIPVGCITERTEIPLAFNVER